MIEQVEVVFDVVVLCDFDVVVIFVGWFEGEVGGFVVVFVWVFDCDCYVFVLFGFGDYLVVLVQGVFFGGVVQVGIYVGGWVGVFQFNGGIVQQQWVLVFEVVQVVDCVEYDCYFVVGFDVFGNMVFVWQIYVNDDEQVSYDF